MSLACFASYLIKVSFVEGFSSEFGCFYINSQQGRRYIVQVRSQQVGQPANVNGTKLGAMPIPLPPLAEQHRIVAEVERRLSVVQQAETVVGASLKRAGRLRQSILKQAFSGKLVPQDPNDDPPRRCWSASAPSAPPPKPPPKGNASPGAIGRNAPRPGSSTSPRRPHDHLLHHRPEALELLQRAARRRPLLRRLPGAAHLPHLPQDDERAQPAALHPCCPTISRPPFPRASTGPACSPATASSSKSTTAAPSRRWAASPERWE